MAVKKKEIEVAVHKNSYEATKRPQIELIKLELPTPEGSFMMALVERFGLVLAKDAGEDSAGRAAYRLMPEEQVVARAAKLARLTFAELRDAGNMVNLPTPEEAKAQFKPETEEV